ncbi:metallophosphoesterase [Flavisolibacter ginsenosidimutans]|uniref:Metallophosphoesterase n=1 Tax=Flavisolibacter ginsenosidimutans TaxID=661481 RepID=A0A5B8UEB8_9BACT|nr:metallophosphoesterase [Flavisolibacter ginsenosidimutans]QEC55017.1 metallophosphoesterase [Flavisolibacter ginsenosidimutans]
MRSSPFWLLFAAFMIGLDIYVFQIVKFLMHGAAPRTKGIVSVTYWVVSVLVIVLLFLLPYLNLDNLQKGLRSTVFAVLVGLFILKLFAAIFFLIDDIRRGIQWLWGKIFFQNVEAGGVQSSPEISRSLFLSWLGIAVGGSLFTSLIYGFTNKYNYKVKRVPLSFPNLPEAFKGLRIVQISDIHSGSFTDTDAVRKGVEKIMALKPDLILFTGDLVNNKYEEMLPYMEVFNKLSAPMGVYSIFGNHDYGDYTSWDSAEQKRNNLEKLKDVHAKLGWRLLLDEHVPLQKNGEEIALIGIQNWSALKNFARYGNLTKAYAGAEKYPFKILMSHDPTHWDAEVRPKFGDIDLTLAGHTHGFQFGVEIPGFRWSPVQYVYRQWAGLYREGKQVIYVNRGYGFIGYPGRVGILPEITLLELG